MQEEDKKKIAFEHARARLEAEIGFFWSRGIYFWTFVAGVAIAYEQYKETNFKYVFILLGIWSSLLWFLAMRGSRRWQLAWEKQVEEIGVQLIGDNVYARSAEQRLDPEGIIGFGKYSVTKIAILISFGSLICWLAFLIYNIFISTGLASVFSDLIQNGRIILLLVAFAGIATLTLYSRSGK